MILCIDKESLLKIIENTAKTIEKNKEYLTRLDSIIGDGDHGINLNRGFEVILNKLPSLEKQEVDVILDNVGRALLESVGGSVGALYGSAIIKAGKIVKGKEKIYLDDLVNMIEAAEDEIKKIGHAELGEKTVLDTIHPFVETLKKASKDNLPFLDALEGGVEAAKKGLESTRQMIAKKGRAKYFGEKTLGYQDVGATSSYLMIESLFKTMKEISKSSNSVS